jgi:trk system potassium uptake protein TrkA
MGEFLICPCALDPLPLLSRVIGLSDSAIPDTDRTKENSVNLPSLGFFKSLRRENRQYAVVGLGRFGRAVCSTLHGLGYEVLGTDIDEKLVAQVLTEQIVSHAVQLDSTEPAALKEAGIFEFDTVIIAIGNYLQQSVISTLNVKEGGVAHVVAKASSEIHGKLLQRVGADHVVYPEHETGCALARSLTRPSILERLDLDSNHSIVEVLVPEEFHGKTVRDLELRKRYGLNLLAVGQEAKFEINPEPNKRLYKGLVMVVIGSNQDIDRLPI